jgi:hypothetical protein
MIIGRALLNFVRKIIENTLMKRSEQTITLSTLNIKFIIRQVDDLFDKMGIKISTLEGTI